MGYCTMVFNKLLIDKMQSMKLSGGCTEIEHGGPNGRLPRTIGLQKMWPGWFEITERGGRGSVKTKQNLENFSATSK